MKNIRVVKFLRFKGNLQKQQDYFSPIYGMANILNFVDVFKCLPNYYLGGMFTVKVW